MCLPFLPRNSNIMRKRKIKVSESKTQEASETPVQSCKMNGCLVIISSCRHCTGWINDAILGSVPALDTSQDKSDQFQS